MHRNNVWEPTTKLDGIKPLKTKCVFIIKKDADITPVRFKAILVIGFIQKYAVGYEETYSPLTKLTTIRTVLAYGVHKDYHFHQMDIKTVFLHGELNENIYIGVPDCEECKEGQVLKLNKCIRTKAKFSLLEQETKRQLN